MTKKSGKFCRNLYDFNVIPLLDKGISVRMDYRGKPKNDGLGICIPNGILKVFASQKLGSERANAA